MAHWSDNLPRPRDIDRTETGVWWKIWAIAEENIDIGQEPTSSDISDLADAMYENLIERGFLDE